MRTLILAAGPGWSELAARLVAGDAVVHIGDPALYDTEAVTAPFDDVVLSGDLDDEGWLSASFAAATRCLGAGRPVSVIVADGDPDRSDETNVVDAAPPRQLPVDVAAVWRVVGVTVEHPSTAIRFQRAADADGATETSDAFVVAQMISHVYKHPEAYLALPDGPVESGWRQPEPLDDDAAKLARERRALTAYPNSKLRRVTTLYRRVRRAIDRRVRERRR